MTDWQGQPDRKFRRLDADHIVATVEFLQQRIQARFPEAGLGRVVAELLQVARETVARTEWIQRPHVPIRVGAGILCASIVLLIFNLLNHVHRVDFDDFTSAVQAVEASISSVVFIGAAIVFLVSWENRIKRNRALEAIHELRAMAHIVDMHQLTKDPESILNPNPEAKRQMTPFELNRYLDYCGDSLALISKIAALYVQEFQDSVLLSAVDEVEELTTGFSRKIWQKITILENLGADRAGAGE
ncbi:MAG: hypothetical protein KF760_06270 [Candidatus Eremiobacteraeota bacterium]|nr:hypothetical protein [Candidatus Eremiobacteraeota bacterium]MCW5866137.1 hypothetical protein [Candidatus Eremiobacteraeota bacterium]